MAYQHGVYTSEVETALSTAPSVDASLPFVVGASRASFGPKIVSSWRQFVELSGLIEDTDLVPDNAGWFSHSLVSFAYFWFRIAGRGECIMQGLASNGLTNNVSDLTANDILNALDSLDTIYEQTRREPSILCVPYFAKTATVQNAMASKMAQYGGRFKGVALCDIASSGQALADQPVSVISDPDDAAAAKATVSPALIAGWPCGGVDNLRFDFSTILAAVMNRVDGENGSLPFVSPSNKNAYITGLYAGGPASSSSSATPVRSFEHCVLMLADTGGDNEGAVCDNSGLNPFISPVDGAEYYVCREYPFVLFHVGTALEDDIEKPAIIAPIVYGEQLDLLDFTLDAYTGSRTVGSVSGCSISNEIVTDYGHAIVDSDGNPVRPIEGATNYKITTDNPELEGIQILIGEYEGEEYLAASVQSEAASFDITGFAPVSSSSGGAQPVFMNRDDVNTKLDGNGIVSALNTASGWVIWGNNTTAYPGSSDVKDYLISVRRMFNYVQNSFQVFASTRIDNPLNRRQLEGVVNSFNQVLASLQGFGALNSAAIELDDERNTTEQLIAGVVYFRIRIAPPPPMKEIHGVFEYDVEGFEASIA